MNSLLIMSDNHFEDISEIILAEKVDYIIHLGDSQFKSKSLEKIDYKVKGNCDYEEDLKEEIFEEIKGIGKIFLLHGHNKKVKTNLNIIKDECIKKEINLCLYGHTHKLDISYDEKRDILILNPGSTAYSRSEYPETYVVLNFDSLGYEILIKGSYSKKVIKRIKIKRSKKK